MGDLYAPGDTLNLINTRLTKGIPLSSPEYVTIPLIITHRNIKNSINPLTATGGSSRVFQNIWWILVTDFGDKQLSNAGDCHQHCNQSDFRLVWFEMVQHYPTQAGILWLVRILLMLFFNHLKWKSSGADPIYCKLISTLVILILWMSQIAAA